MNNYLCTYYLYGPVRRLDAISQGPKNSISRAQHPPTCPSNGCFLTINNIRVHDYCAVTSLSTFDPLWEWCEIASFYSKALVEENPGVCSTVEQYTSARRASVTWSEQGLFCRFPTRQQFRRFFQRCFKDFFRYEEIYTYIAPVRRNSELLSSLWRIFIYKKFLFAHQGLDPDATNILDRYSINLDPIRSLKSLQLDLMNPQHRFKVILWFRERCRGRDGTAASCAGLAIIDSTFWWPISKGESILSLVVHIYSHLPCWEPCACIAEPYHTLWYVSWPTAF